MLLTIVSILFAILCCALALLPVIFIFHNVYEDGAIGRIGLAGISFLSSMHVLVWMDYDDFPDFPFFEAVPIFVLQVLFFTIFLAWHLIRFHLRVVLKGEACSCVELVRDIGRNLRKVVRL